MAPPLSGWTYWQQLDFASQSLSTSFSNKIAYVKITSSNANFWSHVKSDGTDVRFTATDGTTLLNFEIRSFNYAGQEAIYRVQVPTFNASSTTSIIIQYGNSGASSGENRTATYTSAYRLNWNGDLNQSIGAFADSTSNANSLTNNGTTDAAGQIGRARQFTQASSQYVETTDSDSLSFGNGVTDTPMLVAVWANMTDATKFRLVTKTNAPGEYEFYTSAADKLVFSVYDASAAALINQGSTATLTADEGTWILVGAYYDGSGAYSGITLFRNNAVFASSGSGSGSYTAMENGGQAVWFGKIYVPDYASGYMQDITLMDATGLTATTALDWMKLEYASMQGTWLTFGNEERAPISISDSGAGTDAVSTALRTISLSDSGAGTDSVFVDDGYIAVSDTGTGTDSVFVDDGYIAVSDTGTGTDSVGVVLKLLTITDSGGGVEFISAINDNSVFFTYSNIPSGETVEYQIEDQAGIVHTAWTSTGVTERTLGNGKSVYKISDITLINGYQGLILWRVSGKPRYTRTYTLNYYETWVHGINALPTLAEIEASTTLAKESSVQSRLAAADFIAPDNAGIAANGAALTAMQGDVDFLLAVLRNKRYLEKVGATWYLVIRNDADTADILRKALKGTDGATEITDIQAAALGMEMKSSV